MNATKWTLNLLVFFGAAIPAVYGHEAGLVSYESGVLSLLAVIALLLTIVAGDSIE